MAVYAVFAYAFLHVPLLILAVFSFNSSRFTVWEGFSLAGIGRRCTTADSLEAAVNSLIIAVCGDR